MTINLVEYLTVAIIIFIIGVLGIFLNRKNLIIMLMSIELILLAINFNFIIFSVSLNDIVGQIYSLFILTVAAAESAIGLAILVAYYRIRGTIAVRYINLMRG
jgi:NADH-quinone oxidoreductase subunit K